MHFCIIIRVEFGRGAKMATLTVKVTERGQVTLRKEVLKHFGVKPGEKLDIALQPNGTATVQAARPKGSIENFIGRLEGKTRKVATIEEINEAAARGWAGLR
jgi:bifunctional DNA-binding transcriptional regulator/antitoxin component of YhaV-PrlF toxin-antitoxin module